MSVVNVFLLAMVVGVGWQVAGAREQTPCNAEEVWERMIAAKGGQERLHAVRVFFYIRRSSRRQLLWRQTEEVRELFVLPHFLWGWHDPAFQHFPTNVGVIDLRRRVKMFVDAIWGPVRRTPMADDGEIAVQLVPFIPETEEIRPRPMGCSADAAEGNIRLEASLGEGQPIIRYYLSVSSALPSRVDKVSGTYTFTYLLSAYANVDGIALPTRVTIVISPHLKPAPGRVKYEINPAYDPVYLAGDCRTQGGVPVE